MMTLIDLPKESRMAVVCPKCGKIEYFYTSMQSPFYCRNCYLVFVNVMPMTDSIWFRTCYYKSGSTNKRAR